MGCTEGIARILVFVANFCFLLVGLALLVVGIIHTINYKDYTDAIPKDYEALQYVPTLSIIVGAIIFFIAFLGCCGALKSSTCMLTSYGAILFIIFLIQIGLGIFALVMIKDTSDLQTKLDKAIQDLFDKYNNPKPNSKESVDLIQDVLKCCGTTGSSYWKNGIPESCGSSPASRPGCQKAFYDFILDSMKLIGIVALTVSVIEVIGAVLALCLSNCIRRRERQGAYY